MDPDANLREQRTLAARMLRAYHDEDGNGIDQLEAACLAELVQALDEWLSRGGFMPQAWQAPQFPTRRRVAPTPIRCHSTQTDGTGTYTCTLPADHDGDHVMTTHPLHPTWKRS